MNLGWWHDGRLAWPLVSAVVFLTVSLIVVDYAWRIVVAPFGTFLTVAVLADGVAALALVGAYKLFGRRTPKS